MPLTRPEEERIDLDTVVDHPPIIDNSQLFKLIDTKIKLRGEGIAEITVTCGGDEPAEGVTAYSWREYEKEIFKELIKVGEIDKNHAPQYFLETMIFKKTIPNSDLTLKKPLPIKIKREEGFFFLSNDYLYIYVGADNLKEAKEEFYDFFINDYKNLITTKEDELSNDVKILIQKYHEYINP